MILWQIRIYGPVVVHDGQTVRDEAAEIQGDAAEAQCGVLIVRDDHDANTDRQHETSGNTGDSN